MKTVDSTTLLVSLALGLAACGRQDEKGLAPRIAGPAREPGVVAVSAAEQSDWLDDNLPKLLAVMNSSPEVRVKIAGSLAANKAQQFSLTPLAAGLAPGDLERLSALINAAVACNPRFGPGAKTIPRAAVTIMPGPRIVRVDVTYPAAPATNELEPGPLTFDVWVCPDRETALALFWCRRGGSWTLGATPQRLMEKLLDGRSHYATPEIQKNENPPGESASWVFPRMAISILLPKGHKPMPSDRLTLIRGNVVVEASTVEYTWCEPQREWLAFNLRHCVPDVTAVLRAIDSGLIGVPEREKASPTVAAGVVPNSSGSRAVPRPGVLQVSAAEQSDWLDANVPKLVAVMAASPEVRTRIASQLSAEKARPFPLLPAAAGLAPGDVERLSDLIHAAVASNRRYSQGGVRPRPTVTVMPETHVVRLQATYPAPAAARGLEPGPLTFDVWICPDRETAIALFWCRKGGVSLLDTRSDDTIKKSNLEHAFPVTASQPELDLYPPGESAYAFNPRLAISVLLPKGREQMPADRLSFLQANIIVEASTVEFTQRHGEKEWLAWPIRQCASDVVAILHAISGGLDRMTRQDKPGSDEGMRADPLASQVRSDPKPRAPQVSAAGQSDWLDENIPKLLDAMTTMAEVRTKIAGQLQPNANDLPPFPLRPERNLTGLASEDFDRLSVLVDAAVGGNPRYAHSTKARPRPTATVMPGSGIVRFEIIYPATPAPQDFELGPLAIDVWVCPYRETALTLFWLRKGASRFLDTRSNDGSDHSFGNPTWPMARSVLDPRFHVSATEIAIDEKLPGESAYYFNPKLAVSVLPAQDQEPMPADRLAFRRGNVFVEASTVEYARRGKQKERVTVDLRHRVPDLVAVLRAIDAGLIRFGKRDAPEPK